MKHIFIAKIAHELNRKWCALFNDHSQPPWEELSNAFRESLLDGIQFHVENPLASPADFHENWLAKKKEAGWTYGPVKDLNKLQHPCMVPFEDLPPTQRLANNITYFAVVSFLLEEFPEPVSVSEDAPSALTSEVEADPEPENRVDE